MSIFDRLFSTKSELPSSNQGNSVDVGGSVNAPIQQFNITYANGAKAEHQLTLGWGNKLDARTAELGKLLHWQTQLTTLIGRDAEFAQLREWAKSGVNQPPIWVISAEGGSGKTRLAAELARELRNEGWQAGFARLAHFDQVSALDIRLPTLMIIDYPEENPAALKALLRAAHDCDKKENLRLLLLTRDASSVNSALAEARAGVDVKEPPLALTAPTPYDGYALFVAVHKATTPGANATTPISTERFRAWHESHVNHKAPLFIIATAMSVARAPVAESAPLPTGPSVLVAMATRELSLIRSACSQSGCTAGEDVVAFGTLFDSPSLGELAETPEAKTLGIEDKAKLREALMSVGHGEARSLHEFVVPRIEPDLYAAAFLNQWARERRRAPDFMAAHDAIFQQLLSDSPPARQVALLTHWNRLSYDEVVRLQLEPVDGGSNVERGHVATLDAWLSANLRSRADLATAISRAWTSQSIGVGLRTSNQLQGALSDDEAERAQQLNNLSINQSNSGYHAGALLTAQQAVEIYCRLARANPAAYEPDLAMSLNNLANRQSATGDRDGALLTAQQAVEIRRRLAQANPAAYEPDLAMSLNNLANRQSATGDRDGALLTAQQAVDIRRRLAQANPAAYEPKLAMSLNNLANLQSATGDRDSALLTAQQAVEIYRRLARANPAAYEPDLAASLNNLANCQSATGDRDGALLTAQQAVEIYRRLARANPAAYEPDLAASLNNLAGFQSATGDRAGALLTAQQAVEIRRRLARANPAAYEPNLAASLNNLAGFQSATGDRAGALLTAQQAVEIDRRLARANPAAHEPDLAKSLCVLAIAAEKTQNLALANSSAQEAVDRIAPWAATNVAAFGALHDAARSLRDRLSAAS
jgi:Tetratricopeptide repeat